MHKLLSPLVVIASLTGCATPYDPVPPEYTGPVARLADTGFQEDRSKGRFYAALAIDDKGITNSLGETRAASYGKGPVLLSRYTMRNIPARPMKVKLIATHQTGAPIHEIASRMAGTFFSVEGVVDFTPKEGQLYQVIGELTKELSCVWIYDVDKNQAATEKICTK